MKFIIFVSILLLAISMTSATGCICTEEYKPVCGIRTYSNKCLLECDGAKLLYPGKCFNCGRG